MVMALGVLAGRRVTCVIPRGGKPLSIPFPEIYIHSDASSPNSATS